MIFDDGSFFENEDNYNVMWFPGGQCDSDSVIDIT